MQKLPERLIANGLPGALFGTLLARKENYTPGTYQHDSYIDLLIATDRNKL